MASFNAKACLLTVLLGTLASSASAGMRKTSMTLYQDSPTVVNGTYASFVFFAFDAALRSSPGGPMVGTIYGTSISNPVLDGIQNIGRRDRHLTFDFGPKGQITADSIAKYPNNGAFLQLNDPVYVAVTGGTLDYFGATGQIITRRLDATSASTHTFEMYCFKNAGGFRKKMPKSGK